MATMKLYQKKKTCQEVAHFTVRKQPTNKKTFSFAKRQHSKRFKNTLCKGNHIFYV